MGRSFFLKSLLYRGGNVPISSHLDKFNRKTIMEHGRRFLLGFERLMSGICC